MHLLQSDLFPRQISMILVENSFNIAQQHLLQNPWMIPL